MKGLTPISPDAGAGTPRAARGDRALLPRPLRRRGAAVPDHRHFRLIGRAAARDEHVGQSRRAGADGRSGLSPVSFPFRYNYLSMDFGYF